MNGGDAIHHGEGEGIDVAAQLVRQVTCRRYPLGGIDEATLTLVRQALTSSPTIIAEDRGDVMEDAGEAREAGETQG